MSTAGVIADAAGSATAQAVGDPAGFGVYVHWPFCAAKCPYCDFNSHVRHGGIDETGFRDALLAEIDWTAQRTGPRTVDSVFFGGGTPSLMSPATVAAVLDQIAKLWTIAPDAEITLEANPTSVEAKRFAGYRSAGVNRVSLGVQALRDDALRALGRLHSVAEALAALEVAHANFARVSFDLIYARMGQTAAEWEAELGEALGLAAGHLSLYQLTIEPDTPFEKLHAAGKLTIPDPEAADRLYALTHQMTADAGLPVYEISNHARPGEEGRHNLIYWRYGEYAGVGPGAHGRPIIGGVRHATATERHPETWRDAVLRTGRGLVECEPLSATEIADEALLMGLRLTEGVDLDRLEALSGLRIGRSAIEELVGLGLVEPIGKNRLRATPDGRFVLNRLVLELSAGFEPSEP
jgi:putative oxygen-independent coproporphyrinogen III oxidase